MSVFYAMYVLGLTWCPSTSKDVDISAKDVVKDQTNSGPIKKELFGSLFTQKIDRVEKYDKDLHPPDKVWKSKNENFGIDSVDCPQDDVHKAEKARFESISVKGESLLVLKPSIPQNSWQFRKKHPGMMKV
ncbi:hypothetical protein Fot_37494 [Forsythia ovata]|uniref:Uncharacterized protein n=1 Tax=Forsythia ovata TaxID=205694 RepID=A0ABD1RZ53_9LAMI